jgi:hypothetical protein
VAASQGEADPVDRRQTGAEIRESQSTQRCASHITIIYVALVVLVGSSPPCGFTFLSQKYNLPDGFFLGARALIICAEYPQNAQNLHNVCTTSAQHLLKICPKSAHNLLKICTKSAQNLLKSCTKSAQKLHQIYSNCTQSAQHLLEICSKAAQNLHRLQVPSWHKFVI